MELFTFCDTHWSSLREAVEARGMGHLISRDGAEAAARLSDEVTTGIVGDREGFDPLLRAWTMIIDRAFDAGLRPDACPLCTLDEHERTCTNAACRARADEWIAGCTDSLAAYCRDLGLL